MPGLIENRIQIAVLDLHGLRGRAADRVEEWQRRLSPEEQVRAAGFRGEDLRWSYVAAHAALHACLAGWLGMDEDEIRFRKGCFDGSGGSARKPAIERAPGMADLRFNLSHTEGVVLIAAALGREIGVDVERVRSMNDLTAMARAVMSPVEHHAWVELPEDLRLPAFYRVWSRKEAYLKAIGLGLFRDLTAVTVPVEADAGDVRVRDAGGTGEIWMVTSLAGSGLADGGYEAALCWQGGRQGENRPEIVFEGCQLE